MTPHRLKTITEYHQFIGLPKPEHPLVSLVRFEDIRNPPGDEPPFLLNDFYTIALKRNFNGKMKYGQQEYDFDEGMMIFLSPGQIFQIAKEGDMKHTGLMIVVHPDFLWNTPLAKSIKKYEFFSYSVHEALHLSDKEESVVTGIMLNIGQEYHSNIDNFSQRVIIAQLELLLTYCERFYHRQFITRKISNHQVLTRLEALLTDYFDSERLLSEGTPTVQFVADSLNVSPNYLSALLKVLTGQSTQQHIHDRLIAKAKEKLSTTSLTVSEIAYQLGFEHSQSFSKLFKSKTNVSPLEFRNSFN